MFENELKGTVKLEATDDTGLDTVSPVTHKPRHAGADYYDEDYECQFDLPNSDCSTNPCVGCEDYWSEEEEYDEDEIIYVTTPSFKKSVVVEDANQMSSVYYAPEGVTKVVFANGVEVNITDS